MTLGTPMLWPVADHLSHGLPFLHKIQRGAVQKHVCERREYMFFGKPARMNEVISVIAVVTQFIHHDLVGWKVFQLLKFQG